jgi:hypothetical protein
MSPVVILVPGEGEGEGGGSYVLRPVDVGVSVAAVVLASSPTHPATSRLVARESAVRAVRARGISVSPERSSRALPG